jgi:hypothetical protein
MEYNSSPEPLIRNDVLLVEYSDSSDDDAREFHHAFPLATLNRGQKRPGGRPFGARRHKNPHLEENSSSKMSFDDEEATTNYRIFISSESSGVSSSFETEDRTHHNEGLATNFDDQSSNVLTRRL